MPHNEFAGLLATVFSFMTFAFFIPKLLTGKAKTSAYAWTFSLITAVSQLILLNISNENMFGLLRPAALCICMSLVVSVSFLRETNKPSRLDYICGIVVLSGIFFALFGKVLLNIIHIHVSGMLAEDVSLIILTSLSILPHIATISGIKKGNHEVPQIIGIDILASLMGIFALNIWNGFTLYGPLLMIILDIRSISYAVYYNAKPKNTLTSLKLKRKLN